eukprot:COSAG04_NODE_25973_length_301_cov_0.762376_1_plen_24_part_10
MAALVIRFVGPGMRAPARSPAEAR